VPAAVRRELTDPKTPPDVRRWIVSPPVWIEVRAVEESSERFPVKLHDGERESILLAEAVGADVLLIDEQAGRTIARQRKLPVSGTLGVLERGDTLRLVANFGEVLEHLKTSGFFISEALQELLMARHHARSKHRGR